CSMGATPWQTYLTCEEHFNGVFNGLPQPSAAQKRYGLLPKGGGFRWHEYDTRFDVATEPNESNRFGWVVEIDPWRPEQAPIKRTALGRFKHESATVTRSRDGHVVVYMGDDEAFEHIYKFVSAEVYDAKQPHADLLDRGTLYVARFNQDGSGKWVALVHGQNGLSAEHDFADQAAVLVHTRLAATHVGATRMDRPEWIAVHPQNGEVYCSLTNNVKRKPEETDNANPNGPNPFGHIIRWRERNDDAASEQFDWNIYTQAGITSKTQDTFACPDGLWFDRDGRLWIQTDVSAKELNKGVYERAGNNQMLVADPVSGEIKRFLTGPRNCELTGITQTPDGRTLFVNIQHPGEPGSDHSDPALAMAISTWPGNQFVHQPLGRPRSATLAIRRYDGGIIGT
ncbi:MAG TPA: PhoX family phosphatase, partial [Xanthobacteraceae bacterium]|nr:PhoX family phosphatase [Xanthobacteraceae bacterium]